MKKIILTLLVSVSFLGCGGGGGGNSSDSSSVDKPDPVSDSPASIRIGVPKVSASSVNVDVNGSDSDGLEWCQYSVHLLDGKPSYTEFSSKQCGTLSVDKLAPLTAYEISIRLSSMNAELNKNETIEKSIEFTTKDVLADLDLIKDPAFRACLHSATNWIFDDFTPIREIKGIVCSDSNIKSISGIEQFTALTKEDSSDSAFNLLARFDNDLGKNLIGGLYLHNVSVSDLTPISALEGLDSLGLSFSSDEISQSIDYSFLKPLKKLSRLALSRNSLKDVSFLSDHASLETLYLNHNMIDDVAPISNLPSLRELVANDNNLSNIDPISKMTELEELSLDKNELSDIESLSDLTKIKVLTLFDSSIVDLAPLSDLVNLTELSLGGNKIYDLSYLSNLTNLESLNLSVNFFSDVTPLGGLKKLIKLDMLGSLGGIDCEDMKWLQSELPDTEINHTCLLNK